MVRASDVQVERLKMIGVIAGGDVAAYDQCKLVSTQIILEMIDAHTCGSKSRELRRRHLLLQSRRAGPSYHFHGIKFPEQIGLSDQDVRAPITGAIGQSRSQQWAGRVEAVGELKELQPEIVARGWE